MWQDWANAILGLCIVFVAILAIEDMAIGWTLALLGGAVTVLGFWEAAALSKRI